MVGWAEKQEQKKELKEKDKVRRENLAKYLYDLSKLAFAGLVIGVIIPLYTDYTNPQNWYAMFIGTTITTLTAMLANRILKQ